MLQDLEVRTVFGLNALREKLLCQEAGLRDVTLEALKFHLGIAPEGELLGEQHPLRLMGFDPEDNLVFMVGGTWSPAEASWWSVPPTVYQEIEADRPRWSALMNVLAAGPYVDVGRVMLQGDATLS